MTQGGVTHRGVTQRVETRRGDAGSSPLGSILALLLGGGAAMVVVALFMTGLAQRQIIPLIQQRAERAVERAKSAVEPGGEPAAGGAADGLAGGVNEPGTAVTASAADSALGAAGLGANGDSVRALDAQIETEKAFLARREAELARLRAGIDSLSRKTAVVDDAELKRQAKLFAAMKADEAAPVLSQMDDETLAALLGAMNAKAAARVMARMDAARMARLASQAMHRGDLTGMVAPEGQEVEPAAR